MTMRIPAADLFSEPLAMGGLPAGPFRLIYADPPWRHVMRSAKGLRKSVDGLGPDGTLRHYQTMPLAEICSLPVREVAADDCALAMWTTWPHLAQALRVMDSWGFTYKTGGAWAKQSSTGRKWQFGTGYIFRSASEPLIVGTRGHPRWLSKSERNLWVAPVREHSRKPDMVYEALERLTPGPRLELFSRRAREGWESWGNDPDLTGEGGAPGEHCHDPRELSATGRDITTQREQTDIATVAIGNKGG